MPRYILLYKSKDCKGIVAKITDFIFKRGGNIVTADQYSTDPEGGDFFMRIEFALAGKRDDRQVLGKELNRLAKILKADCRLYDKNQVLRMGILVSRPDHCLSELLYLWRSGELRVEIPFVISNYQKHREIIHQYNIPFYYLGANKNNRKEAEILEIAKKNSDFLVLARYMLVLSVKFLKAYDKDIINIHHGFLPSFKGARPYKKALDKGVKVIGATAHFVNETLDDGPIISQQVQEVSHRDDLEALVSKGKILEKHALAKAVSHYVDYRIIKYKNKTIVF